MHVAEITGCHKTAITASSKNGGVNGISSLSSPPPESNGKCFCVECWRPRFARRPSSDNNLKLRYGINATTDWPGVFML